MMNDTFRRQLRSFHQRLWERLSGPFTRGGR